MEEQVVQPIEAQVQTPPPEVEKQPTPKEANMHTMRKMLEAEEKARKDAENRAIQAEKLAAQLKAKDTDDEEDEEVKELNVLKQRLAKLEIETATSKMTDFNSLVSDDNLKTLERLYPEEFESIMYNPNPQARARVAYNMMTKYGIVEQENKKNQQKIENNLQKPSMASVAPSQTPQTPLAKFDQYERRILTDEEKDKIMKEVARKKRMS